MAKAIHMMVRVRDEARSVKFYETCFGLKISDRKDWPDFTLIYLKNPENDFEVELTVNKAAPSHMSWATATAISRSSSMISKPSAPASSRRAISRKTSSR